MKPTKPKAIPRSAHPLDDWRGGVRLVIDGVIGVTGVAESLHRRIARVAPPIGKVADEPTRGITGLVYRSIRGTTGLVGMGLDAALATLQASMPPPALTGLAGATEATQPARDAVVSALNGVMGDHLERSGNPLAIAMRLQVRGPLMPDGSTLPYGPEPERGPRVLLLVHGLCMNDLQWTRNGHDHGQFLAKAEDFTPVYARYNTGRHISTNGRELAAQLEALLADWPVPVEQLAILGHSMGGLVARSAVHQAVKAGMAWPAHLRQLIFLGTPHHGAPMERGGNWLHRALGISPYVAPFARLSGLRSEGITDLRYGNLLDEDWMPGRFSTRDTRTALPLPSGVACHAIAGSLGRAEAPGPSAPGAPVENEGSRIAAATRALGAALLGDGLVPVASALGRHTKPSRNLRIPPSHQWIAQGVNHLDLLSSPLVARQLRQCLGG